jgi:quercetin dioxygenase-like cupin family protein
LSDQGQSRADSGAILRRRGDGRMVESPVGGAITYLARGEETGEALTFLETVVPPGEGPPLHQHVRDEEFIYVLEGMLRVRLGDSVDEAPAGSFVFIPRGLTHTWQSAGDGPARFLVGFAPAAPGMERFFERSAELAAETRMSEAFSDFAGEAGMTVLGPPLGRSASTS